MKENITLSLIIPAFNEEKIINKTLATVTQFLKDKKYPWEIIVVDDGSSDNTSKIVKKTKNAKIRLVKLSANKGKGAALRAGIKVAKGDYILYSDADLSVSIANIDKFMDYLKRNFDLVIGSRRIEGAEIAVHQSWLREMMGRAFTLLTRLILFMNISDFTCGFKGFKKAVAKDIFSKSTIDRWAYDSEILFIAKIQGYRIKEIPIVWKNRQDTRVVLKNVVFETLKDLLKIRINHFSGRYNK